MGMHVIFQFDWSNILAWKNYLVRYLRVTRLNNFGQICKQLEPLKCHFMYTLGKQKLFVIIKSVCMSLVSLNGQSFWPGEEIWSEYYLFQG